MLPIKGLQKTSLIDFSPYTTSVIFIGGCNFRCKYCHNFDLVLNHKDLPTLQEKEIIDFLQSKHGWIDALTVTGGEPTLYPELVDFLREVKKLGLKIKLDTNGTNPDLLWDILDEGLVDYVAMDFKAPLNTYDSVTVFPVDTEKIARSVSLLKNSEVDYEFRATIVPKLLRKEDMQKIGEYLSGSKRFAMQPFRAGHGLLDKTFENEKGYSKEELEEIRNSLEPYFEEVIIRDDV